MKSMPQCDYQPHSLVARIKTSLRANIGILGRPLNKSPDWPGSTKVSELGSSITPSTNSAGVKPLGNSKGQKGDESHWGISKVPFALVFCACLQTLGTRWIGGHHQLFSPAQEHVKASTASAPGDQNLELNLGI